MTEEKSSSYYHQPTTALNLQHIKNRLIFSNKHDRNLLFPTNATSNNNNVNNNNNNSRNIIFHGALTKLGTESFFTRQNRRYCFLLADMLIITKEERQERLQVRQVVALQNTTISDLFYDNDNNDEDNKDKHLYHDFRLNAPDYGRNFVFRTNFWNTKHRWVLELRRAISNLQAYTPNQAYGWHHQFSTDTIFFHSIHGNLNSLKKLQEHLILYNNLHNNNNNDHNEEKNNTPSSIGWAKVKARVHQLHEMLSVDEDGASILHYASAYGHIDIVQYLLDLNAFDINLTDHNLFSPLHCAAYYGHPDVLELLLKNGADHAVRDLEDKTPIYMCIDSSIYSNYRNKNRRYRQQQQQQEELSQQQENDAKDVVQIVIECIQILAKYNCDLDVCDSTGDSILIHASKGQNVEIVETLLKLGAGPLYKRETDGKNALHVACEANSQRLSLPIIEVLIQYGKRAMINSVADDNVESPLLSLLNGSACISGSTKGAEALKLLEKNGAYISEKEIALSGGILSKVVRKSVIKYNNNNSNKQQKSTSSLLGLKIKKPMRNNNNVNDNQVGTTSNAIPIPPSTKLTIVPPNTDVDSPRAFA